MARNMRVRAIRRQEVDEEKLALAFLLLAKTISEQQSGDGNDEPAADTDVEPV